jgi:RinA family phage transcriptional activator
LAIHEERLNKEVFRYVERQLYDYPSNKSLLKQWEEDSRELAGEIRSAMASLGERVGNSWPGDPTSVKVIKLLRMGQKAESVKPYVKAIEATLETLKEQERILIEEKYFQQELTNAGIARKLNISEPEFYLLRKSVIHKFAARMALL